MPCVYYVIRILRAIGARGCVLRITASQDLSDERFEKRHHTLVVLERRYKAQDVLAHKAKAQARRAQRDEVCFWL